MTTRLGCGLAAFALAGALALAYLVLAGQVLLGGAGQVDLAVVTGSLAWLAAGIGVVCLAAAARAGSAAPRRAFGPASPAFWLLLFAAALIAGSAVLALGLPMLTVIAFPPLHVAAALAPALAVTAYVAWRAGAPAWLTWTGVVRQLLWGGVVATGIALVLETIAALFLGALVLLLLDATQVGPALADSAYEILGRCVAVSSPPAGCDAEMAAFGRELMLQPLVIAALFALFGLLGPLSEETAKVAGVAWRRPPRLGQAWAWGIATGAGFGILEAVMFGAMALAAAGWAILLLGRACTTVMHATLTGFAGVGWFEGRVLGRRGAGAAKFALAVGVHGLWNSLALTAVLAALLGGGEGAELRSDGWAALASLAALGVVFTFAAIFLGFLARSSRYGRDEVQLAAAAAGAGPAPIHAEAGMLLPPTGTETEPSAPPPDPAPTDPASP